MVRGAEAQHPDTATTKPEGKMQEKEFHAMTRVIEAINVIAKNINDVPAYQHTIAAFNEFLFQASRRDVIIGNPDAGAGKCSFPGATENGPTV